MLILIEDVVLLTTMLMDALSESPAAYKDILVLTKMQIRMAMWDVPLLIRVLQMTPVGTLIGNLY